MIQGQDIFVSPKGASLQPKMSDGFLPGSLASDTPSRSYLL